jgi:hypothetical protein
MVFAVGCGENEGAKGGDPFEATVQPAQNGTRMALPFGATLFEVDTKGAGRVVTFSIDGVNVLAAGGAAYGSGFWPSPQNAWPGGWPPPSEFETSVYSASAEGNVIVLGGTTTSAAYGSLRATKRFWANAAHQVVTIEYTIHNDGSQPVSVAPWEDSRVYPGGMTFFPEAGSERVRFNFQTVPFTSAENAVWLEYLANQIMADSKTGADGAEGWIAHVECHAALERTCLGPHSPIFIKTFADIPQSDFAPGEAELELFADASHTFVELEEQGSYAPIAAGGQRSFTVHWYLRSLPDDITPMAGNVDLLDFVRRQIR